jgi:hypothetical protein
MDESRRKQSKPLVYVLPQCPETGHEFKALVHAIGFDTRVPSLLIVYEDLFTYAR